MPGDTPNKCPVCRTLGTHESLPHYPLLDRYICPRCGVFVIAGHHATMLRNSPGFSAVKISALLRERTVHKGQPYLLVLDDTQGIAVPDVTPISMKELLLNWPHTVPERLRRALVNLAALSPKIGTAIEIRSNDAPVIYAADMAEVSFYIKALQEDGFLSEVVLHTGGANMTLTARGWQQVDELTRLRVSPEHPVFVAMWFGKEEAEKREMMALYENGIAPGVRKAGYRVTRVDLEEHNDYVMDKVIGLIRTAPFVVADFTGHRNGVYFEAGLARGYGLSVINCCKKTAFEDAHFDTQQLNHILWDSPEDLQKRLELRIRSSIGEGPHKA